MKGKGGSHQDKSINRKSQVWRWHHMLLTCHSVEWSKKHAFMKAENGLYALKLTTFTCWKLLSLFHWPFPAFWDSSAFLHGSYLHQSVLGHIQLRYWFMCMENARLHFFCRETQEWGKAFKREASLIRKTEGWQKVCVFSVFHPHWQKSLVWRYASSGFSLKYTPWLCSSIKVRV